MAKYLVEVSGKLFDEERVKALVVVDADSIDTAADEAFKASVLSDCVVCKDRIWSKEWLDTHTAMDMFNDHIKGLMNG